MNKHGLLGRLSALVGRGLGPVIAVLMAFVVSGVLIRLVGVDPLRAYSAMLRGSVGSLDSLSVTAVRMTPLLLAGLGVGLSFRTGIFNVGAEGQLYLGAVFATIVGLLPWDLPMWIHLPLAIIAGAIGGALWAAIPGYFRAYRGVSEVVMTLMMNYVGIHLTSYLVNTKNGPLGEPGGAYSQSPPLAKSALLPVLVKGTNLHAGFILAIVLAVVLYVVINYLPFGFRLRMLGANPTAATYAGVPPARNIMYVMLLSGALAGLAGAGEVLGLRYRLFDNFSPGYGFDAIAVALLANSNPLGTIFSAGFFGALRAGANQMQQTTGIEVSIIYIIQALTLLFAIGGTSLRNFRRRKARAKDKAGVADAG